MSDYSAIDKILHRVYLSNYFIAKSSFELEDSMFGTSIAKIEIAQYVFVTGLARAGTTSLMRLIYETDQYASLTYNNMPFLFMPNLWKNKKDRPETERAHKDGIKVSGKSPEEFDEYFWKVFLKDSYINDRLHVHQITEELLDRYKTYVKLVALSQNKTKWLAKNNNNILRIGDLAKLNNSKILILYRSPVDHASSLLKLHKQFELSQLEDAFVLEYFNYLGHHEFGLNHKPFELVPDLIEEMNSYDTSDLNYWIIYWINYYQYVLDNFNNNYSIISFEDLSKNPDMVTSKLALDLKIEERLLAKEKYTPPTYPQNVANPDILERANQVYNKLNLLRTYC